MYDRIEQLELETTDKCNALCPMCVRTRNAYPDDLEQQSWIKNTQLGIDQFRAIASGVDLTAIRKIELCGNFSDPLANTDLQEILGYAIGVNPRLSIRVATNGSLRSRSCWRELGALSRDHDVTFIFGLDGASAATHSMYRVQTSFDRALGNARELIAAGGKAEWQYLIFRHNEHELDTARNLAEEYGFNRFFSINTDRMEGSGELAYVWKGENYALRSAGGGEAGTGAPTLAVPPSSIDCIAQRDRSVFIDSDGHVLPCCYLGLLLYLHKCNAYPEDEHADLRATFDALDLAQLDATRVPLQEIVKNPFFTELADAWKSLQPQRCVDVCGTADVTETGCR